MRIQDKAAIFRSHLVRKHRENGDSFISAKDDAPEWVSDVCRDCHGDFLPDDWRYSFITDAADLLAECSDPESIDIEPDVYTSKLTDWLASSVRRVAYCDDYLSEFGAATDNHTISLISGGQYLERREVLDSLIAALERLDDEIFEVAS
jgi:hypothetical protein